MQVTLVLLSRDPSFAPEWRHTFAGSREARVVLPEEPGASDAMGALVYEPPPGALARYRHLRVIFNMGAGVEALLADPTLPDVPIVRLQASEMSELMREYVVYQALRIHRRFPVAERNQAGSRWQTFAPSSPASGCSVTVLGLGRLGLPVAQTLATVGFKVRGWSKSRKDIPGIRCLVGAGGLQELLPTTELLVCVLPLTPETRGILSENLFASLPNSASLISVSRAGCLCERHLLAALASGRLAHATLDCFDQEPLPATHPFWRHPSVTVTPHMAADPTADICAGEVRANLARLMSGQPMQGVVDRTRGY